MQDGDWVFKHNAMARKCIVIAYGVPADQLRDDITCAACDELHRLMHLDPDVTEILSREPWCDSCRAGDKSEIRTSPIGGDR
jgi:hypothetical protein